ncbi:hypothetical protein [Gaetbulibacter jejuensis]
MKAITSKHFIAALSLFLCLVSCQKDKNINKVNDFYDALNNGDYTSIETLISDDLRNYATHDFLISDTKEKYKEIFQWDSVFSPEYKVLKTEVKSDTVYVKTEKYCKRIAVLYKKPLITKQGFVFKDNLIHEIFEVEDTITDFVFWNENKSMLIEFVKTNYPELSDFEKFQNKAYGERYLKVIDLYKKDK